LTLHHRWPATSTKQEQLHNSAHALFSKRANSIIKQLIQQLQSIRHIPQRDIIIKLNSLSCLLFTQKCVILSYLTYVTHTTNTYYNPKCANYNYLISVKNVDISFLPRDASAERGDATVSRLSVCLSVRP